MRARGKGLDSTLYEGSDQLKWILRKWKLGRAAMAGCNFEEDDGGGGMGKKS
jgi:hypothetical protein